MDDLELKCCCCVFFLRFTSIARYAMPNGEQFFLHCIKCSISTIRRVFFSLSTLHGALERELTLPTRTFILHSEKCFYFRSTISCQSNYIDHNCLEINIPAQKRRVWSTDQILKLRNQHKPCY